MKKRFLAFILTLCMVMTLIPAFSIPVLANTEGDFEFTISNGEATVTGYTGSETDLVIPDTLGGNPVVAIGFIAFQRSYDLVSISIPKSVSSIGIGAFQYCSSLTNVSIPNSVTNISSRAFYYCTSLASISIPEGATIIEDDTFRECRSLASIYIPYTVSYIGEGAFYYCTSVL